MTFDIDAPADTRTDFQREAADAFQRGIATLTDLASAQTEPSAAARVTAKRDALASVWERQGDRIQNAKSLDDVAAIIGFITMEGSDRVESNEGTLQGEALAVSYLRSVAATFLD